MAQRLLAEDLVDALGGARNRRRRDDGVRRRDKLKVLLRMGQRVMRDQRGNMRQFGRFGAQKFAPRRSVEEQIGDGDRCSARQGRVFDAQNFSAGDLNARARGLCAGRGVEGDSCDGRDRRQSLAAKSERGDRKQIVGSTQLRSGVAFKGQQSVVAVHALAVVGHANQLASAAFNLDANAHGSGVEGILQQAP